MNNSEKLHVHEHDNLLKGLTEQEKAEVQGVLDGLFAGKTPRQNKIFVAITGVAGAGKSRHGRKLARQNLNAVLVDVNDNCLAAIPGYISDVAERGFEDAYEKWRNASNWISINANRRALAEGYDLIMVGTGSSPRVVELFQEAKDRGYPVYIESFAAPVEICLERNKAENRKSDVPENERVTFLLPENHITDKRQPYFDNIPAIVTVANKFTQYWNPTNDAEPVKAFRITNKRDELSVQINNFDATNECLADAHIGVNDHAKYRTKKSQAAMLQFMISPKQGAGGLRPLTLEPR